MEPDIMPVRKSAMRKVLSLRILLVCLSVSLTTGCDMAKNQLKMDRAADMEVQDFRDGLAPRQPETPADHADADSIPALQPYVAPVTENMKAMPLVSISVNQTVPLRDALFELAKQADYDIELDPRIAGSVIFTAREKPFDVVVDKIADIAGLRYKFTEGSLRVEMDTPYNKSYKIDYLSFIRKNKSSIRNDVSVVSGQGADTGSAFEAASESEADFWGELQTNMAQILGVANSSEMKTALDPRITAVQENPAPVEPVVASGTEGEEGEEGGEGGVTVKTAPPAAVLRVESLPADTGQGGSGPGDKKPVSSSFAVNKQAGIVSVYATERQHKEIEKYLTDLKRSVTSQVLIEAKVMEVSLSDEFATGIDWSNISFLSGELALDFDVTGGQVRPQFDPVPDPLTNLRIAYTGNDVNTVIDAISRFGTVRALASPRLTVLNNQSAALNVADNRVYFEIDIDVTTDNGVTQTDISSDIKNVPEGVLINVQPSIDLDDKTISMSVRPTVTRVVRTINDPAVAYVAAQNNVTGVESPIPVVNVQEIDSVVQLHSGQALVMGGLMQDRTDSTQLAVPVLGELPVLGGLFRNQVDKVNKTELVIFLKATIVDGSNVHDTDKDLYRTFSGDRRPLRL